jgi:tRNA-2-methylthio-N6-dimethylallyladenosine synthase
MNVYDSRKIQERLSALGYRHASTPETADMIIVNTCAIREKAEQKAYSILGRFTGLKQSNPHLLVGVGGCVAQQEGRNILERLPGIDFVFGTHGIDNLPGLIDRVTSTRRRVVDVEMAETIRESNPKPPTIAPIGLDNPVSAFVTIMRGCDNYCAYCVVPYVRGREISREPDTVLDEIRRLVASGVREVTLLGQNVNSYGKNKTMCTFPELLSRVNRIEGLLRIRFTTSHPRDLSDDLITAFGRLEKLCSHIHLPVQSGSNRVLKRMNRGYTREAYLDKIDRLRRCCPDIAISSDMIVGFPGETRNDFDQTLDLIDRVRYDGLFAFKYSDRPNAPAARFTDKLPEQEKKDRLQQLLDLQEMISARNNRALTGSTQRVLVEGKSKKHKSTGSHTSGRTVQWTGRTPTNKIVNFVQDDGSTPAGWIRKGSIVFVRIENAFPHSLLGRAINVEPISVGLKGEKHYAA